MLLVIVHGENPKKLHEEIFKLLNSCQRSEDYNETEGIEKLKRLSGRRRFLSVRKAGDL